MDFSEGLFTFVHNISGGTGLKIGIFTISIWVWPSESHKVPTDGIVIHAC
jgi:hypothetical protein